MSPSEADLRAALRDGEGDRVDPYDIIHAARERRAHRRTVLLSAAAAVVFVGAAAAGGAALLNGGHSGNTGGGATLAGGGAGNAGANTGLPSARGSLQSAADKPPMRTGQIPLCFGPQIRRTPTNGNESSGSLLPGPVTSFVVCATPVSEQGPVHAQPVVVTGAAAHSLAASLSNAATSPVRTVCPFNNATTRTTLTMTPVTATGQHLPALSATIESAACSATVTNGTTTRYGWRLPPRVAALLRVAMSPSGPEMPIDLVPSRFHKASGSPSH